MKIKSAMSQLGTCAVAVIYNPCERTNHTLQVEKNAIDFFDGWTAADTDGSRYSMVILDEDSNCLEDSAFGWYLREVDGELKATAWSRDEKRCEDYEYPSDIPLPDICYGPGSLQPMYKTHSRIDDLITAITYADHEGYVNTAGERGDNHKKHTRICIYVYTRLRRRQSTPSSTCKSSMMYDVLIAIAVHKETCMPLWTSIEVSSDSKSRVPRLLSKNKDMWALAFFGNASSTVASDESFGTPSYCN